MNYNPLDIVFPDILSINKYIERISEYPGYIEGIPRRVYYLLTEEHYIDSVFLKISKKITENKIKRFSKILIIDFGIIVNGEKKEKFKSIHYPDDVAFLLLLLNFIDYVSKGVSVYSKRYEMSRYPSIYVYLDDECPIGIYSHKNKYDQPPNKNLFDQIKKYAYED